MVFMLLLPMKSEMYNLKKAVIHKRELLKVYNQTLV